MSFPKSYPIKFHPITFCHTTPHHILFYLILSYSLISSPLIELYLIIFLGVDFLAYMESGDLESAKTAGENHGYFIHQNRNKTEMEILFHKLSRVVGFLISLKNFSFCHISYLWKRFDEILYNSILLALYHLHLFYISLLIKPSSITFNSHYPHIIHLLSSIIIIHSYQGRSQSWLSIAQTLPRWSP